jgi:hypothetical protein
MTLLYVAGIIHAGLYWQVVGSPELWVATLVMVIALTYVRLVTRDLQNDLHFTAESVDQLPLTQLVAIDLMLSQPDFLSADEAVQRERWRSGRRTGGKCCAWSRCRPQASPGRTVSGAVSSSHRR